MRFAPILLAVFCLAMLALRYFVQPADNQRRTSKERLRYVRILVVAGAALAAIGIRMHQLSYGLDGKQAPEPSFFEQIILDLAKGRQPMTDPRECPDCGCAAPVDSTVCCCGYVFATPPDKETAPKPAPAIWLAFLPAILTIAAVVVFILPKIVETRRVAGIIGPSAGKVAAADSQGCIETYNITLKNSEFYVRQGSVFRRNTTPEISTVVEGMARNTCAHPLRKVEVFLKVRDDTGKRGSGWAEVKDLGPGQSKRFEKAWMGRITSYEIGAVK